MKPVAPRFGSFDVHPDPVDTPGHYFPQGGITVRKLFVLCALAALGAALLTTTGSAAAKPAGACGAQAHPEGNGRFGGVIRAQSIASTSACARTAGDPAGGTPPLLYQGGPVMANTASAPLTVTPIFWNPTGHSMPGSYKDLLKKYLQDVAVASGSNTNVYSTNTEYFGSNGSIGYNIRLGRAIDDKHAMPPSGCTVASNDTTNIYSDGSGYDYCLDDAQLTDEIQRNIDAGHLPQDDYSHIYVIFTAKHVESCFNPGDTTSTAGNQACTINHQPTAAYCAYHSMMGPNWPLDGTIYANMPYPIIHSPVGYTCGSDAGGHTAQSPNRNLDADTETSPTSHEISEAITDPNVFNGWIDSTGYENGDECAYVYGAMVGKPGQMYNQVINKHHYLTQEEFSNTDYANTAGAGGCVQSESAVG